MAEENESPADNASQPDETSLTRRSRAPRTMIRRPMTGRATRARVGPEDSVARRRARCAVSSSWPWSAASSRPSPSPPTARGARPPRPLSRCEQVAADDAQSLVVASDATSEQLERGTYSATTPDEIADEEGRRGCRRSCQGRRGRRGRGTERGGRAFRMNLSMTAPGSGEVRWPVSNFTYASYNLFRPSNRPNHNGFDMVASAGHSDLRGSRRRRAHLRRRATTATVLRSSIDSRRRRSAGLDPLRSHDLRQPSGRLGAVRLGGPAHRSGRQHRQLDRATTCTSRSWSTAAYVDPLGLAPDQRRLSPSKPEQPVEAAVHPFSDTPPRVHLRERPAPAPRALA